MNPDRSQAPPLIRSEKLMPLLPQRNLLDNGIPLYRIAAGDYRVCRIDLLISAGTYLQDQALQARFTNTLLTEGTAKHNAYQLALKLERCGAYLQSSVQKDFARLSLSVLSHKLAEVLPLLQEVFLQPAFSDEEFDLLLRKEKKAFADDQRRVQAVAAREFNALVFGEHHPYGGKVKQEDFDRIAPEHLRKFHTDHYLKGIHSILLSGQFPDDIEKHINSLFGQDKSLITKVIQEFPPITATPGKGFTEMEGSVQNAIRIGKSGINTHQHDFHTLQVCNTLLGGYFGSRLMSKIREEKGYTYGIYSMLVPYLHTGLFMIGTETGSNVWKEAIRDIYDETDKLCQQEVEQSELDLVLNYMTGSLQRSLDNPLNTMGYVRVLLEAGLDPEDYLKNKLLLFQQTDPQNILETFRKYLQYKSFSEFVCGAK